MAEIAIGRYDTNTLKTPQLQDYGSVYAAVGNALNQKSITKIVKLILIELLIL